MFYIQTQCLAKKLIHPSEEKMVARRNIYKGVYLQRGNGFGSVLSGLFRVLVPFLKRGAKTAIRSAPVQRALKSAKKSAIKAAGNAAGEVLAGRNPKERVKIDLKKAQEGIEKALLRPGATSVKRKTKAVGRLNHSKIARTGIAPLV